MLSTGLPAEPDAGHLADARRRAAASALGSLRAEGLELGDEGRRIMAAMTAGTMTWAQARDIILAPYRDRQQQSH